MISCLSVVALRGSTLESFEVIYKGAIRYITIGFQLVFHYKYICMSYTVSEI